ncbi:MAG: hypothetical protein ABIQ86_07895 [Steroidobacteraceae bacterium]
MRRNLRQRIIAGALALLAQAGLIAWISQARVNRVEHEADSSYLIFIEPLQKPVTAPVRTRARASIPITMPAVIPSSDTLDPMKPIESNRAITVTPESDPPMDWYRDIEKSARSAAEKLGELALHGELLDSKPRVLELPADVGDELAPVTATRLDNGDLVTTHRINDKLTVVCVHEHIPLTRHFDIGARQRAPNCRKIGTPNRDAIFDDIKPGNLRKPLPLPRLPQTDDKR